MRSNIILGNKNVVQVLMTFEILIACVLVELENFKYTYYNIDKYALIL